jgi:16S rRNA processing protein RimM
MRLDECFQLGQVIKPHGKDGALVIYIDADDPTEYTTLESVLVDINGSLVPFFIEHIQLVKEKRAIARFDGVTSMQEAENLRSKALYLPLASLPPLPEGQFYYHDIIDYLVVDEREGSLGRVSAVYTAPSQDLLVMHYQEKEVLIPVQDHIVIRADHEQKQLLVALPDGLLDVYLNP